MVENDTNDITKNLFVIALQAPCKTLPVRTQLSNLIVISEIQSLYRDDNDLLHTIIKRIYEEWDENLQQWNLLKVEFIFENPDFPLRSDNPAATVEARHGWVIPPEWEFISEVREYRRKSQSEITYDHDSEVGIIR